MQVALMGSYAKTLKADGVLQKADFCPSYLAGGIPHKLCASSIIHALEEGI